MPDLSAIYLPPFFALVFAVLSYGVLRMWRRKIGTVTDANDAFYDVHIRSDPEHAVLIATNDNNMAVAEASDLDSLIAEFRAVLEDLGTYQTPPVSFRNVKFRLNFEDGTHRGAR